MNPDKIRNVLNILFMILALAARRIKIRYMDEFGRNSKAPCKKSRLRKASNVAKKLLIANKIE